MEKIITTDRLLLRAFTLSDVDAVFDYACDEETVRYLLWDVHKDKQETQQVVERLYMPNPYCYCIEKQDVHTCIGCFELRVDEKNNKVSFGYVLNRRYWNQGYMTEVLRKIIAVVFNELTYNRIESTHYVGNEASGKVMQKCGMRYEGTGKEEVRVKNKYFDVVHYGLTRTDWQLA